MAKKLVIISSSLRPSSNSELLARNAEEGAKSAGYETEFITLKDKDIRFCRGCLACQTTGNCVIRDDVLPILEAVKNADTLLFATPVYYYGISGQLKTLLDRLNPLYIADYKFRDVYLLTTSAEDGEEVYEKSVTCIQGWTDCFPKSRYAGVYSGGGAGNDAISKDAKFEAMLEGAVRFGKEL